MQGSVRSQPSEWLENREIAEHMAITEKVVEKHITRALKRFRDGLRRYALLLGTLLSLWNGNKDLVKQENGE